MSPRSAPLELIPCWRERKAEEWAEGQFCRIPEERGHIELEFPRSTVQTSLNLGQVLQVDRPIPRKGVGMGWPTLNQSASNVVESLQR